MDEVIDTVKPSGNAIAKIVSANDQSYRSQKFIDAGYYAFGECDGSILRICYAVPDDSKYRPNYIALSDGPDLPLTMYISARAFDYACWCVCLTVAEAEKAMREAAR